MKRAIIPAPSSELRTWTLPLLWLGLLAAYVLAGTPLAPFHGDESTLIYMSRDYAYLFLDHDLNRVVYSDSPASPTEQELRLLNGTLPKYLIGLAWHAAGFTENDLNEQWDWGADWAYNQQTGHAPAPALLLAARWSSALLLAAGVVPMFLLGKAVGGGWTPYLASLYYALSPPLLLNGRRAMMEGSVTLFSLLVVLAGVWVVVSHPVLPDSAAGQTQANGSRRSRWLAPAALGLASGLALASKHTAAFTVAAVFAATGVYGVRSRAWTRYVMPLIFAAVVAAAVFLALNPAWWSAPLKVPGVVLRLRADLLQTQVSVFGGYDGLVEQAGGFFRQVFTALPQYYEAPGWAGAVGDAIARYEVSPWRGVSVGGSSVGGLLLLGMMIVGLWRLARGGRNAPARLVVGAWALAAVLATLILTPLEWQRYYLPAYPAVGLLAALGVDRILRRWLNRPDAGTERTTYGHPD